jgi:hypothetical protein
MVYESETSFIREIKIAEATLRLRTDGIVHVVFHSHVVLDIPLQLRLLELYRQLTEGRKTPFLFSAMEGVIVTKEARDNAIKLEDQSPVCAVAVLADNLAYRIIANFYLQVNKPKNPYKVFKNQDEAIRWLLPFLPKS